jgi:hypothetical protein
MLTAAKEHKLMLPEVHYTIEAGKLILSLAKAKNCERYSLNLSKTANHEILYLETMPSITTYTVVKARTLYTAYAVKHARRSSSDGVIAILRRVKIHEGCVYYVWTQGKFPDFNCIH